ncbi:hypothetical protein EES44_04950 [Streptomyces sp. ADI96-15]|uniref:hypothetical protein n=1 Tax=Streptomyces TaxID=1883 RepID=UPI0003C2FCD6|nr:MULTISPECIES: hypothetical protein [unclassified Streptomyces]ESP97769.1 hypothetical protein B591_19568 [Streptomyces sp. GBA 94-10 4N24]ESQ04428.1 hypothetical protein B590_19379 [Streptomyces sp. PVA_94-07]RPK70727.1 hypothetical protein EES44_04950 [Streptomyces sp. ADI96-15]UZN60950.1 hypothetical protein B591N_19568 [Streptomyces sp. GBA 94-10 4N24]
MHQVLADLPGRGGGTAGDRRLLLLEVTNPPPATPSPPAGTGGGSGVDGIRERAALLGGRTQAVIAAYKSGFVSPG